MTAHAKAIAKAPASIANLAVGFDLLGQAFAGCYDIITASKTPKSGICLGEVSGLTNSLPQQISKNTALRGANAVLQAAGARFGVRLDLHKNIPLSAGLGGSAASSVAAVIAVNALLEQPFSKEELLDFALEGERASSDPPPKDNVSACLYGGLVLASPGQSKQVVQLPCPKGLRAVVIHPQLKIETGESRKKLLTDNSLTQTIDVAGRIAAFVHACHKSDISLLHQIMQDVLIEPQRASTIPPFYQVQKAALNAGAICCSISGSGPSIFAWALQKEANDVQNAMLQAMRDTGILANAYQSPLNVDQCKVIEQ